MLWNNLTRTAACNRPWSESLDLYEELDVPHDHRLKELHCKNFSDVKAQWTSFPCCHFMKAAEVKGLIKPALRLAETYRDMSDDEGKHVVVAMRNLSAFYDALKSAPMAPNDEHKKRINDSMTKFFAALFVSRQTSVQPEPTDVFLCAKNPLHGTLSTASNVSEPQVRDVLFRGRLRRQNLAARSHVLIWNSGMETISAPAWQI